MRVRGGRILKNLGHRVLQVLIKRHMGNTQKVLSTVTANYGTEHKNIPRRTGDPHFSRECFIRHSEMPGMVLGKAKALSEFLKRSTSEYILKIKSK